LTNHNLCDMFYTLTKMFVYKLLLRVSQNSGHYQKKRGVAHLGKGFATAPKENLIRYRFYLFIC